MAHGRDGTSLGLSLCKSLVELNGGVKLGLIMKLKEEVNSGLRGILVIYLYRQYQS